MDKKSSAELSEAINSMFRWYEAAEVCYAYLSDVQYDSASGRRVAVGFEQSKWFTRGWTLQDLGSRGLDLFDHNWEAIGTRESLTGTQSKKNYLPKSFRDHWHPGYNPALGLALFASQAGHAHAQR